MSILDRASRPASKDLKSPLGGRLPPVGGSAVSANPCGEAWFAVEVVIFSKSPEASLLRSATIRSASNSCALPGNVAS